MKDTFADTFKTYYDGDPEAIPLFNLPCIIVTQTTDETEEGAFAQDDVADTLTIKVVLDKREDWDGDKVNPNNMTERRIRNYIGARDPVTGLYDPRTVKSAVRSFLLDKVTAVAPKMSINYGINLRERPNEGYAGLTAEGHVTFDIQYSVNTTPQAS